MLRSSRTMAAGALIGLALAGCKKPMPVDQAEHIAAPAPAAPAAGGARSHAASAPAAAAAPMLAYDYGYGLRLPSAAVRPLMSRHEQACVAAGPALCQVVSADVTSGSDDAEATLKLRAAESWLTRFRASLDGEAKAAGGRVQRAGTQAEDLTRQLVDTGAAIRAKTLLRDRLEQLLASRPGKLSDLLELEQNLAQVQGEIDAAQSELAVMQARVAMSSVTIAYSPAQAAISGRDLEPLAQAARGFAGNALGVTAGLVTIASFLLPPTVLAALAWLGWRWRSRRRLARQP